MGQTDSWSGPHLVLRLGPTLCSDKIVPVILFKDVWAFSDPVSSLLLGPDEGRSGQRIPRVEINLGDPNLEVDLALGERNVRHSSRPRIVHLSIVVKEELA